MYIQFWYLWKLPQASRHAVTVWYYDETLRKDAVSVANENAASAGVSGRVCVCMYVFVILSGCLTFPFVFLLPNLVCLCVFMWVNVCVCVRVCVYSFFYEPCIASISKIRLMRCAVHDSGVSIVHAHTRTHEYAHTHTYSLSLSHTHTHTHTHTNTNIYTHTHVPDWQSKQQNPIRYPLSATHCSTLQHPATHYMSSDCTSLLHITVWPIIVNTTYRTKLHTHSRSGALMPVAGLNLLR